MSKKSIFVRNMAIFKFFQAKVFALFLLSGFSAFGQEFNASVEILSPQIQLTNKQVFQTMQKSIENFLNTNKFTVDKYKLEERIDLNVVITISKMNSQTEFSGNFQMVVSRPVYGSGYNSTTLRVYDEDLDFEFKEFEPLEYIQGAYTNNLTSVLAFYAYMALGIDADSFSELGGTEHFSTALNIANTAQTSSSSGWSATDKDRSNRYWFVFQMIDERFRSLRMTCYGYHRLGMDKFTEDMEVGRASVLQNLEGLMKVHRNSPNSFLLQVFVQSKRLEIIDIFSKANQEEKNRLLTLVESIDIANISKYREGLDS